MIGGVCERFSPSPSVLPGLAFCPRWRMLLMLSTFRIGLAQALGRHPAPRLPESSSALLRAPGSTSPAPLSGARLADGFFGCYFVPAAVALIEVRQHGWARWTIGAMLGAAPQLITMLVACFPSDAHKPAAGSRRPGGSAMART